MACAQRRTVLAVLVDVFPMTLDQATTAANALQAGAGAYHLGRWEEARGYFEQAQRIEDSPEAAEGIALVSWFLEEGAT
jgi:2-phospho-L-lactate transferase/gluconeogenesis factor (CofD/UPF0052 family)